MTRISKEELIRFAVASLLHEIRILQENGKPLPPMIALLRAGRFQVCLNDPRWVRIREGHRRPRGDMLVVLIPSDVRDSVEGLPARERRLEGLLRPLSGTVIYRALEILRNRALEVNRALV